MSTPTSSDLQARRCTPCESGTAALSLEQVQRTLTHLEGWETSGKEIWRAFRFANFHETMAFVNAIAWIAHRENHHPDLEVGYNRCLVRYSTHAIGGISENDLICASKVNALVDEQNVSAVAQTIVA